MASKFQQRHYETIALILQELRLYAEGNHATAVQTADKARSLFTDAFARDSGVFKRDRFERACVPNANVRKRT